MTKIVSGALESGLTMQEAVDALAYKYPEREAYMQRIPTMTNGPRWVWYRGKLWLQGGIGEKLVPPRPITYPEAKTSHDWAVFPYSKSDARRWS